MATLAPLTPLETKSSQRTDLIPSLAAPSYFDPGNASLGSPPASTTTETIVPANSGAFASLSSGVAFVENLFSGPNLENIVFILLGLLLIGGGIFAFRSTQNIINTGGKVAARVGEVAAA